MKTFDDYLRESGEIGYVQSIVTPLIYVSGLPTIKPQELVLTERGSRGIAQVLAPDSVEVLLLEQKEITHQERVARMGHTIATEVSKQVLGRIIDPFGIPLDGHGPIAGEKQLLPLDKPAPGILERVRITEPLETGVTVVDLLVQIGKGQKELIAGDQKTGKTSFLVQTIINQAKLGTICIYVFIGKRKSDLKSVEELLVKTGALKNSVIIAATSSDPVSYAYFAPFAGFTLAEFFRDFGRDSLVVLDDMTTHAKYYREIALVSKKTPGRGSYPGDLFHLQARMLERSGKIKLSGGKEASITSLPVAETQEGDLTGYIQTNLMAMTDGHIYFDVEEFKRGRHPSVNHALSVTRVGNQTQSILEKELRAKIVSKLNDYYRIRETSSFGVEVPIEYKIEMDIGEKIELLFNQEADETVSQIMQHILFGLLFADFWAAKDLTKVQEEKNRLVRAFYAGKLKKYQSAIAKAGDLESLITTLKVYRNEIAMIAYGNI